MFFALNQYLPYILKHMRKSENCQMEQSKKKNRLANFTVAEENLLINLAEQHSHIIENKRTDAVFSEQKQMVWEKIDAAFEAQMGIKRGAKNIKEKYENLKRKAKKVLAEERKEVYKTGGGSLRQCVDTNTQRLAALMGQSATGLSNTFDSDAIKCDLEPEDETYMVPEFLEESMQSSTLEPAFEATEAVQNDTTTDLSAWNPKNLKTKKHEKLNVKSSTVDPAFEATEAVQNDITTDWSAWNPKTLKTKKHEKLNVKSEKKKQKGDQQQIFWEENKRAAERHEWAREKNELEMMELNMKLQLLEMEINQKKSGANML